MALIRRHPLPLAERDPFGLWIQDWPELFGSFRSLLAEDQLRVEEFMDGDTLVIRAELPGIDPDTDVELTVGDGMLHIHAQRRQTQKVEDKDLVRSELRYGAFTRTLPLPVGATDKDIDASYKAGILEVRVPVDTKKAAATKIPIRTT
jgi:HSP20 family protein